MKKLTLLIMASLLLVMCKSAKSATTATEEKKEVSHVQYRDDFRAVSDTKKKALLSSLKATGENYAVLIFTKGYKGEKVTVSNATKSLYNGNLISDLKTGIAHKIRIDTTSDTKVYDSFTKKEVVIEAAEAKKHKFVYLMKDNGDKNNPFFITYSNTLRPLE